MALPQQVIDRLAHEPPKTPGWSSGIMLFSGGILFLTLIVYFGLAYGYEPYINNQIGGLNAQISTLAKAIAPADQTKLVTFYSEITNMRAALASHVALSRLFSWLEKNTEANVYFGHLTFSPGNQLTLTGVAKNEADINEQALILETAPETKSFTMSGISFDQALNNWQFTATIIYDPAKLLANGPSSS